jgi:uncharacterized protein YdeI (BOF family)
MKQSVSLMAFAVMLGLHALGYALDPFSDQNQPRSLGHGDFSPSFIAMPETVEGNVVRIDPDSYVIRDLSGRDVRVYVDRATMRDNVAVGDRVLVRFDRPSAPYAASIVRRPVENVAPGVALPRPQTIEGEVLRVNPDNYVIRDLNGKEVRLHIDTTTKLDGNLTPGDKVVARVVDPPVQPYPYAKTIYKLNSGQAIEGQVVTIDGNTYVVRDINGVEYRVSTDTGTLGDRNIIVGDRVVILKGDTSMLHAESISKR